MKQVLIQTLDGSVDLMGHIGENKSLPTPIHIPLVVEEMGVVLEFMGVPLPVVLPLTEMAGSLVASHQQQPKQG